MIQVLKQEGYTSWVPIMNNIMSGVDCMWVMLL
jgi:hypothetical protein